MTTDELENYTPKGQLEGFPKEIIARLLECQEEQGNKRDIKVFEKYKDSAKSEGGFDWDKTEEEDIFWGEVIVKEDFDLFFEEYPKQGVCSECKECRKQEYQESKTTKYVQVGDNAISNRWRAERNRLYYFINFYTKDWFFSDETKDCYDPIDNENYNSGNYFRTEVEAEIIAQKLNTYLKQLIKEEHEYERN
jgi:hypothetical protein